VALRTPLTELLGITHPVLLAPMGGVAGGRLAAAVTAAGGLGIIGGGYGDARLGVGGEAWMEHEFRAAGNARIGVGYITWSLVKFPHLLEQALARNPVAFFLSFGDESTFAPQTKASGAKLICQVHDVAGARRAVDAGADIIVAQGSEAGGHGKTTRSTFALVPAVVDAVDPIPVVAAGGVGDGRGLAAALALGASGVLIGTRFWASDEALGAVQAKQLLVSARGDDTVRTRVFDIIRELDWPMEYSGRAISNDFTNRWHGRESALEQALGGERDRYWKAAKAGDVSTAVVFAGEGLDMIHDIKPAGDILRTIVDDAETALKRTRNMVSDRQ
jgi:nitronate monooxygenase